MSFKPWSVSSLLRLRCPTCGANTFRNGFFRTAQSCSACGHIFERESGFYAGAVYPMYAFAVVLGGICIVIAYLAGCSFNECLILAGLALVLASPWLFWYSRLFFIHTDHRFFGNT